MKHSISTQKIHTYTLFSILLILLVAGFFFSYSETENTIAYRAESIIESCRDASYRPSCYDVEIPKLMDSGITMEEAYEVTRYIQSKDEDYFYCHVLGHNLSAKETAKDPSKWKDVVTRSPSGMCSNGGIHGAFQERFRAESLPDSDIQELEPILGDICHTREGWNPTQLEKATCTHALGHLSMYVTGGNIQRSVALCERVAVKNLVQICFDGAFMQIFQPLEPEDVGLVEDIAPTTPEEAGIFCSQFEGFALGSCHSESWPLSYTEIITPHGLEAFCSIVSDTYQKDRCYNALFYVVTAQFGLDTEKSIDFCSGISEERQGRCFANSASRFIEVDWSNIEKSVSLCVAAKEFGVSNECFNELLLYSTYNFHPNSKEFFSLCKSLPREWQQICLSRGHSE